VLNERRTERLAVVEEDVDPDTGVRARDPRHVAQRAPGRRERVVPVDTRRTGLVERDVGERVREMARYRDEPVVRLRVDRDRTSAERGDETVNEAEALWRGRARRSQKPGGAVEQLRRRTLRAPRFGAADGMTTDETGVTVRGAADGHLRRADVRDGASVGSERQRLPDLKRQRGDRRGHEDELRRRDGGGDVAGRLDSPTLGGDTQRVRIRIPTRYALDAGSAGGEPGGRTDQTRADDGHRTERSGHQPRISSATRNARSSDCLALSRGSQS